MSNVKMILSTLIVIMLAMGCTSEQKLKEQVTKIMKENPKILADAIEADPVVFVEAFQKAIKNAQGSMAKKKQEDEKKQFEKTFDNPLVPNIRSDEAMVGPKDAPITLVEYSDFECPFCHRGYETVKEVMKKYKGKIRFIYKHLPLSFHQNALPAAKYFEAVRLQDPKKAFAFHDMLFDNFKKVRNGEVFFKKIAKKIGADMKRLAKDLNSSKVMNRINEDKAEAAKFGFRGTPGFILNGVPIKGAYPASHFDMIIGELKKRGKIVLK